MINFRSYFSKYFLGVAGILIILLFVVTAIFAPWLSPYDPLTQKLEDKRIPPNLKHPLGTDQFGRDILSRIIFGSRYVLLTSISSVGFGLILGTIFGMTAGYVGGAWDEIIMRTMDVLLSFPYLLLAILIVSSLGAGIVNTIVAIGIWLVPVFARVARGSIINIRDEDYIHAADALGASNLRIIWRHAIPNIIAPVVVYATLQMAYAILMESSLSFLGLGIQPPTPSWARMIADGRNYITVAPHIATVPGLAILFLVLAFNLLGDELREVLDPTVRRSV